MAEERDRGRLELRFATSEGLDNAAGVAVTMGILIPIYDRYVGQAYSQVAWQLTDYLRPEPTDAIIGIAAVMAVLLARRARQIYTASSLEATSRGLQWNGTRLVPSSSDSK